MAQNYVFGDRLWVRLEGYDWWPARVLSDKELAAKLDGQTREANCDLALLFYAGSQTGESITQLSSADQAHNVCYFETSSEKAVTDSEDLRTAIQNASEDATANPLKVDQIPAAAGSGGANSSHHHHAKAAALDAAARKKAASKRPRDARGESDSDDEDRSLGRRGNGEAGAARYESLPSATLTSLAQRITAAVSESDVPMLRILLCELDRVDVSLAQLEESKIGVAVGNIIGNEKCRALWPLARALVSFWARHLDSTTLAAIRRVQEGQRRRTDAGSALTVPGSPMSPASPLRFNSFGSPHTASPTGAASPTQLSLSQPTPPLAQPPQRNSFFRMLCQLLDSPENSIPVATEAIEKLARELVSEVSEPDDRGVLLSRLRNPELAFVRDNLITGRWTPKQYAEQPDEAFITEREKEEEKRRVVEKMKALDSLANVGLNKTEMFKCANCGSRNCSFYEQQTRGADEPTTKFITCLECKKAWTEE